LENVGFPQIRLSADMAVGQARLPSGREQADIQKSMWILGDKISARKN